MGKNNSDFRDKAKIITTFNSVQEHYERFLELKGCDAKRAEDALNTSGTKLYSVFEWIMKYHLFDRYSDLAGEGVSQSEAQIRRNGLLKADFFYNGQKYYVNTEYLVGQMEKYASPSLHSTNIKFNVIKNNRWKVNNAQKHIAQPVNEREYQESFCEIRKMLLTYVDSNAPIQIKKSLEYSRLQEDNGYWKVNPKYDLCLVIDDTRSLQDKDMQLLTSVPWSLILDFNEHSEVDGLLESYISLKGYQPNLFDPIHPNATKFNPWTKVPYWFLANGRDAVPSSITENIRQWRQKYGAHMSECIEEYHKVFPKPIHVVIVDGTIDKIRTIVEAFDTCYENDYKIYLLSNEPQFEEFLEDAYKDIVRHYPMAINEFCDGLHRYATLLEISGEREEYTIVGKEGTVPISPEKYSHFEVLYCGIADNLSDASKDNSKEEFYQGKTTISWYGAKNEYGVIRRRHFKYLCSEIESRCKDVPYSVLTFYHDPGAGGTTLARQVAYHVSQTHPVVVMQYFEEKQTSIQLGDLYDQVHTSIVIIAESTILNEDEVQRFEDEMKAASVPHVIVFIERLSKKHLKSDDDLTSLYDEEFDDMCGKLQEYSTEETFNRMQLMKKSVKDRYPFFMSLYVFDEEFKGVPQYIKRFRNESDEYDFSILTYISLLDKYTETPLRLSFFAIIDEEDEVGIFHNNINDSLVMLDVDKIKMRHPLFSTEILEQAVCRGRTNVLDSEKGERLAQIVINFIKESKTNNFIDYDYTINILKSLLIIRNTEGIVKDDFSQIISTILKLMRNSAGDERYNAIGRIFKTLEAVYPDEAHFKAHLSRFYTNIEKNYIEGINKAKESLDVAKNFSIEDALLYHIYGISEKKYIEQKLYKDILDLPMSQRDKSDDVRKVIDHLKVASGLFERARQLNHKSAGYISDLDMCINVVDFGKKYFECSTMELVLEHKDSWFMDYYDRAISLMDNLNTLQVDDDYGFQQRKISSKYYTSIQDMEKSIEKTIDMWEQYLLTAVETSKPLVRRFIARARKASYLKDGDKKQIDKILELMEENISKEPTNENNIRIWFNALRYSESDAPEIMLDSALSKLAIWKNMADNREAYYYYFVLTCIKANEGSSRAEAQVPILMNELRTRTANMPNKNVIYEWLGRGKGIRRLFSARKETENRRGSLPFDDIILQGDYLTGVLIKYSNERSALISSSGMEVFFTPSPTGQTPSVTKTDVGKKVRFIAGFSYDGVRALNRSVQIIDDNNRKEGIEKTDLRGRMEKCCVTGYDHTKTQLFVKLVDYRNMLGRVRADQLPEKKRITDYKIGAVFHAKVIDVYENGGKTHCVMSLRDEDKVLDDWQKKLRDIASGLREE